MAGEWKAISLDKLYDFSSGLSKPRSAFGSGYPFLSFKDVFQNIFVLKELTERVSSTEKERQWCSIRRGDVFLTRTSETMDELGMSCVALRDIPDATFNGFTKRLRPKTDTSPVPEYAGYYFRSPGFRRDVTAMSSLSTRASLNNEMLARLCIHLPPPDVQAAIGRILGALDDKIELNRRTNETLEAMARALFKSWFVDFDPVRAKAEGRDPGLPRHIADLFPDRLVESELGETPEGWAVRKLSDLCTTQYGHTASAVDEPLGPKFLRVTDINKRNWIEWSHVPHCSTDAAARTCYGLRPGDIVVARMADPGKSAIIDENIDAVFASYLVRLQTASLAHSHYVYDFLKSDLYAEYADGAKSGSVQASMNAKVIVGASLVVPPASLMERYLRLALPIRRRLVANVRESSSLASLRDALLPKLISGELRIKDADRLVAEADA